MSVDFSVSHDGSHLIGTVIRPQSKSGKDASYCEIVIDANNLSIHLTIPATGHGLELARRAFGNIETGLLDIIEGRQQHERGEA